MASNHTHAHKAQEHFDRGRGIAVRTLRDEAFEVARLYQDAAKTGAAAARAAVNVRDGDEWLRIARKHAASLVMLPPDEPTPFPMTDDGMPLSAA